MEDRLGGDDLLERRLRDPADAHERVANLVGLRLELRLVPEILETAAAAGRVVLARRVDTQRARIEDLDRERLRMPPLHLRHAGPNAVAGKPAADEDDEAVQPRDAVAAEGERLDGELQLLVTRDRRGHVGRLVPRPVTSPEFWVASTKPEFALRLAKA